MADHVAFDGGYGSAGQALIVSQESVILFDLNSDTIRTTLTLPADGRGLAVDAARRRAFVTTQLSGQFTRSVQVIDLDNATLGANIGLTASVIFAQGMAVVPATGDVLVVVGGAPTVDGLMVVDPGSGTLGAALQNVHHPSSFLQPVAVAVLDQGGLNVAVVANSSGGFATLVPLASMTFTPDDPAGGGQPTLAQVPLSGAPRAVVGDPGGSRALAVSNSGGVGQAQIISVTGNQSGSAGADIELTGTVIDQGLAIDTAGGLAFAALGSAQVAVIDLDFGIEAEILQASADEAHSVSAETGTGKVLIVGAGSNLSGRCP
jgi:hypothetical protein